MRVTKDYEVPAVYVTESGSAWADQPDENGYVADPERTAYLMDHIAATARAYAQGAPVRGYFAWSLLDNFEWDYGLGAPVRAGLRRLRDAAAHPPRPAATRTPS